MLYDIIIDSWVCSAIHNDSGVPICDQCVRLHKENLKAIIYEWSLFLECSLITKKKALAN